MVSPNVFYSFCLFGNLSLSKCQDTNNWESPYDNAKTKPLFSHQLAAIQSSLARSRFAFARSLSTVAHFHCSSSACHHCLAAPHAIQPLIALSYHSSHLLAIHLFANDYFFLLNGNLLTLNGQLMNIKCHKKSSNFLCTFSFIVELYFFFMLIKYFIIFYVLDKLFYVYSVNIKYIM